MKNKLSILTILCTLFILSFFSKVQASTDVTRISGDDRYKTSIEICKNGWNEAEYVILASGENFPDALCAAPLAKKYNAPIILIDGKNLTSDVSETLSKLHTKNILIIGGNGSISEGVEASLKSYGYSCRRICGNNRFQTSTAIAKELGNPKEVVVVNGENYPDGLSVSPAAAMKNIPILLVDNDSIDESIKNYLKDRKIESTYIVGGTGVINTSLETYFKNPIRISGDDRYSTNIKVFEKFFDVSSLENSFLASGEGFPDALAGSALSAKLSKPLLLTDYFGTAASFKFIEENKASINKINVIGGGGAIRPKMVNDIMGTTNKLIDNLNCLKNSTQVILVEAPSFGTYNATASTYELVDGKWSEVISPFNCVLGLNGFSTDRHEGDKTTPTGAYNFQFFFGWNGNPGFKFPYKLAGPYDYWVSNKTLDEYNVWMTYEGNPKERFYDYEHLASQPLYKYAAVINFNYGSDKIYGKGSGIFMHIAPYSGGGTLGCVGFPEDKLLNIMMWMDPTKNPSIIMGPTSQLEKM